jgi:ankyrin repeat protein
MILNKYEIVEEDSYIKFKFYYNEDDLTQDNALNISTFNDNYEISEILILKNISINNINTFNRTPLYNVIYNNNYKLCELLVKSDADINQICDNYMRTPLSLASTLNNMEIIELLIYYGADESILDYSGKSFYSNLDYYHKDLILSKYPTSVYTALVSENKFNGTFMEFLKINKLN